MPMPEPDKKWGKHPMALVRGERHTGLTALLFQDGRLLIVKGTELYDATCRFLYCLLTFANRPDDSASAGGGLSVP